MSTYTLSRTTERYVRKGARISNFAHCVLCGTAWGGHSPERRCEVAVCLACQSPQCLANGLGRGQCSICYVGLLSGWSGTDRPCRYKGCNNRAIAAVPRKGYACRDHLTNSGTDKAIERCLSERGKNWELAK